MQQSLEEMKTNRKQIIDGVNNIDYWTGKSKESMRDNFLYYHESILRAVRINQWKVHFETSEIITTNIKSKNFQ